AGVALGRGEEGCVDGERAALGELDGGDGGGRRPGTGPRDTAPWPEHAAAARGRARARIANRFMSFLLRSIRRPDLRKEEKPDVRPRVTVRIPASRRAAAP